MVLILILSPLIWIPWKVRISVVAMVAVWEERQLTRWCFWITGFSVTILPGDEVSHPPNHLEACWDQAPSTQSISETMVGIWERECSKPRNRTKQQELTFSQCLMCAKFPAKGFNTCCFICHQETTPDKWQSPHQEKSWVIWLRNKASEDTGMGYSAGMTVNRKHDSGLSVCPGYILAQVGSISGSMMIIRTQVIFISACAVFTTP